MLKHVAKDALEIIRYNLLYSKKKVKLLDGKDRRDERTVQNEDADDRTDNNIDDRTDKFQN